MKSATPVLLATVAVFLQPSLAQKPSAPGSAVSVSALLRERTNVTQWFAATPTDERYAHQDSLLRLGVAQRIRQWDDQLELGQSTELALPTDAVSPVGAQGQLGLGGTYYAANSNNRNPVAASFRQGYLRYHFRKEPDSLRLGRFEFFDGQEIAPANNTLAWLQTNRIGQRLIGNFGFSNGQRSFDGAEAKAGGKSWNRTAMAGRATQGVFNMNANPELNVDIQYLAYTRVMTRQRIIVRGFGLGYHDGRTAVTKTDNRAAAARAVDHRNIRIGTFGGNVAAAIPLRHTTFDLLAWGAGQFGSWGVLSHAAGAIAVEGGVRLDSVKTAPWLRGGYLRSTGDNNAGDGKHNTFFQVLPTPRIYARFPFHNLMNSTDSFVQAIDKPGKNIEVRSDLHFLRLTSANDLWYQGGGAFDNKVFGYVGRPANSRSSFSTLYDLSADVPLTRQISLSTYYAHVFGKSVVGAIYPSERGANFGYLELTYKFQKTLSQHAH